MDTKVLIKCVQKLTVRDKASVYGQERNAYNAVQFELNSAKWVPI